VTGWTGAAVAATVLAVAAGAWLLRARTEGRFHTPVRTPAAQPADPTASALSALGVPDGAELTLLQFSSAFCAPCRATRALCADVAARVPGVRHLDVDADSNLDAVRALDIWRTPTVLIVDRAGQIRRRATGAPTRAQLLAAVNAELA
jgi:hypothetical protein